jgi:hypothetical protein
MTALTWYAVFGSPILVVGLAILVYLYDALDRARSGMMVEEESPFGTATVVESLGPYSNDNFKTERRLERSISASGPGHASEAPEANLRVAPARPTISDFNARLLNSISTVEYRPIISESDRAEVFRLRYEAYIREGVISPHEAQSLEDAADSNENAHIVGVYIRNELISSIRIQASMGEMTNSSVAQSFPEVTAALEAESKTILEANRFVARYDVARQLPELPYLTLRIFVMAAEYYRADHLLVTVRAEHEAFYRRAFYARPIFPPRSVIGLTKPLMLLGIDFKEVRGKIYKRLPVLQSSPQEQGALFRDGKSSLGRGMFEGDLTKPYVRETA